MLEINFIVNAPNTQLFFHVLIEFVRMAFISVRFQIPFLQGDKVFNHHLLLLKISA